MTWHSTGNGEVPIHKNLSYIKPSKLLDPAFGPLQNPAKSSSGSKFQAFSSPKTLQNPNSSSSIPAYVSKQHRQGKHEAEKRPIPTRWILRLFLHSSKHPITNLVCRSSSLRYTKPRAGLATHRSLPLSLSACSSLKIRKTEKTNGWELMMQDLEG